MDSKSLPRPKLNKADKMTLATINKNDRPNDLALMMSCLNDCTKSNAINANAAMRMIKSQEEGYMMSKPRKLKKEALCVLVTDRSMLAKCLVSASIFVPVCCTLR